MFADPDEVQVAKKEFLQEFDRALNGLLVEMAPTPLKAQVRNNDRQDNMSVVVVVKFEHFF